MSDQYKSQLEKDYRVARTAFIWSIIPDSIRKIIRFYWLVSAFILLMYAIKTGMTPDLDQLRHVLWCLIKLICLPVDLLWITFTGHQLLPN